jgi:hypothetical protein
MQYYKDKNNAIQAFEPALPPDSAEAMGLTAIDETEVTATQARIRRDALLATSDWTQLPDIPLSPDERQAWAAYRQALRDISEQPGWPETIAWPAEPEGEIYNG